MIREMLPQDVKAVGQIWLSASIDAHDFVPEEFWRAELRVMTEEILPSPRTRAFVFDHDGDITGFISLGGTHVGCLFVRPDQQRRGAGRLLLSHAQALHPQLDLTVYKQNPRAVRFYEREGFHITGESVCQYTGCPEFIMIWRRSKSRSG